MATKPYEYPPLPDAATHIRLLQIGPGTNDDDIVCSQTVHRFADAPAYAAISYTWGEPPPTQAIVINGVELPVRHNCHYALWQARHHVKDRYIWLDALCIAQHDVQEKNYQVQMMGEIYQMASCVIVSLGPDDCDFGYLAEKLAKASLGTSEKSFTAWYDKIRAANQSSLLYRAVIAMGKNRYWSRVWIVQELILARRIEVMCGNYSINWPDISALMRYLPQRLGQTENRRSLIPYTEIFRIPLLRLEEYKRWRTDGEEAQDLDVVLSRFGDNECSNPLDRIYGFLHIIEWPESERPGLSVDYNKSPLQLAVDCLDCLVATEEVYDDTTITSWAQALLKAVKVDSANPEIVEKLHCRHQRFYQSCLTDLKDVHDLHDQKDLAHLAGDPETLDSMANYTSVSLLAEDCLQIHTSAVGSLTGDVAANPDTSKFYAEAGNGYSFLDHEYRVEALSTINQSAGEGLTLQALMQNDVVVAMLCCRARPGDYMLQLRYSVACPSNPYRVCLFVRQYTDRLYEIIGHGLMSIEWLLCGGGERCTCAGIKHNPVNGKAFEVRFCREISPL